MVTMTYPGEWRCWVPDGRELERHRQLFGKRWQREWGALKGVWVKEFQESGRPHLHTYLMLPENVSDEDFEGLRARTVLGQRLERQHGRYRGRSRVPPIGGRYGGGFGEWLLRSWAEVVGTRGTGEPHERRGVDVRVCFWSEGAAKKDRAEVARYFFKESGKLAQKVPPDDFGPVGRYWGYWGASDGFRPLRQRLEVSPEVALQLERRMTFLVRWRIGSRLRRTGTTEPIRALSKKLDRDGLTVYGISPQDQDRMLRWAVRAALTSGAGGPSGLGA